MSACDIERHTVLPFLQSVLLEDVQPYHWRRVADFITGLLERQPLATGNGWAAERLVLGCLATELRQMALDAGEPDGPPRSFGQDPVAFPAQQLSDAEYLRESDDRRRRRLEAESAWRAAHPVAP